MVKITLFGLAGTGTSTVAKLFCEKYNSIFMSGGNIFRDMAKELNLDVYEFNKLCQSDKKYDLALDKKIEEFGVNNENFVFESRMAWYFIPDSIKIKLICDFDTRIDRICERDSVEGSKIADKTVKREESEKLRYNNYYSVFDYSDDEHFDLIVDSTNLSPEEIVCKINEFIDKK